MKKKNLKNLEYKFAKDLNIGDDVIVFISCNNNISAVHKVKVKNIMYNENEGLKTKIEFDIDDSYDIKNEIIVDGESKEGYYYSFLDPYGIEDLIILKYCIYCFSNRSAIEFIEKYYSDLKSNYINERDQYKKKLKDLKNSYKMNIKNMIDFKKSIK